jgi:hypothetical protein
MLAIKAASSSDRSRCMAPDMGLAVLGAKVEAGYREWFRAG